MSDVTILVSTYDAFSESWKGYAHGIQKYWPSCPWPIVWTTNFLDPPIGTAVKCGEETNWTYMTRMGLESMDTTFFIFSHCDYWLTETPDITTIVSYVELMRKYPIDHIQLLPCWDNTRPDGPYSYDETLLYVHRDSMYRSSNQMSLWRVQSYLDLLVDGESPWRFEVYGSKRARDMLCLCVKERGCINYVHRSLPEYDLEPVVKGVWTSAAHKYCEREGIEIDFTLPLGGKDG